MIFHDYCSCLCPSSQRCAVDARREERRKKSVKTSETSALFAGNGSFFSLKFERLSASKHTTASHTWHSYKCRCGFHEIISSRLRAYSARVLSCLARVDSQTRVFLDFSAQFLKVLSRSLNSHQTSSSQQEINATAFGGVGF